MFIYFAIDYLSSTGVVGISFRRQSDFFESVCVCVYNIAALASPPYPQNPDAIRYRKQLDANTAAAYPVMSARLGLPQFRM